MSLVVGIDLSLTSTGIALATNDYPDRGYPGGVFGRSWALVPPKELSHFERLHWLFGQIRVIPQKFSYADLFVIEGYSYGSKQGREIAGEVRGAAIMAMLNDFVVGSAFENAGEVVSRMDLNKIVLVPPTSLKKFVLGKGAGDKDMMRLGVYKRWGFEAATNDEVDAYALARIGLAHLMGDAAVLTVPQQEVIDKVFGGEVEKGKSKPRKKKGGKKA